MPVAILGTQITLWCFDLQSSSKFKILIGADNDIDDLKEVIKEKCGFASPLFKLWRVNTNRVVEEMLNDELVDTAQTIGETFYGVEGGNIRVAVNAPEQPVSAPDNSVSIFIDNSNLFIEGAKIVGQLENVPDVYSNPRSDLEFYVDHGLLVTTVLRGRKMRNAFVVGSVPPENDTLWARARDHGCEVTTYERNASNKEKKVDTQLTCYAMRTLLTKTGSTILIVAGDGDYCPVVKEAKKENWKVETWFWDGSSLPLFPTGMNAGLKNISSYVSLDDYYKSFTYITGPDLTNNKSILEIHGNVIKSWPFRNERLMICFCELKLFGRWYWLDDMTAYLYFESDEQLDSARSWFRRNYSGMLLNEFKQKQTQMGRRNSFRIHRGKW